MSKKIVVKIERPRSAAARKWVANLDGDSALDLDVSADDSRQLSLFRGEEFTCENVDSGLQRARWEEVPLRRIVRSEEKCWQCGACVGFCPTDACFVADRRTMEVGFVEEKCVQCETCLTACPSRAMQAISRRREKRERVN